MIRRARRRLQRGDREVGGPGAEVEDAGVVGEGGFAYGARAPAHVETDAENVIEKIVALGDRVEHRRDALR